MKQLWPRVDKSLKIGPRGDKKFEKHDLEQAESPKNET